MDIHILYIYMYTARWALARRAPVSGATRRADLVVIALRSGVWGLRCSGPIQTWSTLLPHDVYAAACCPLTPKFMLGMYDAP